MIEPKKLNIPHESPLVPEKLSLTDKFQFKCHKGIACFNKCCHGIDIILTPYDIIRLKNHFKIDSNEFLAKYTVPFEMDGHGMPGVKFKEKKDEKACQFLTDEGCSVYENRPVACRYYALGLMSMRAVNSPTDEDHYFIVKEDHCLGHQEDTVQTIGEYRTDQGVDEYDEINREWRQIILKKRSSGPAVGQPSKRSFQMYFMASYNIDYFKNFVLSDGFKKIYKMDDSFYQQMEKDELALFKFAFKFLKQVLFGEVTIPLHANAIEERMKHKPKVMSNDKSAVDYDATLID